MRIVWNAAFDYAQKTCETVTRNCTPAVLAVRLQTAFRAGVEFSQRWIPVDDSFHPAGNCLIKDAAGRIRTYQEYKDSNSEEPITHYRPIDYKDL